jgi:hypothetical protein
MRRIEKKEILYNQYSISFKILKTFIYKKDKDTSYTMFSNILSLNDLGRTYKEFL